MADKPLSKEAEATLEAGAARQKERTQQEKLAAASAVVENKPKNPGKLRNFLSNLNIGSASYLEQMSEYNKWTSEHPETAETEVTSEAEEVIADEAGEVSSALDRDESELSTLATKGELDPAIATEATQQIEALKEVAQQTAAATAAEIKKPSLWSKLKETFTGSVDHTERKTDNRDETADKVAFNKKAEQYKKLTTGDKEVFDLIKSISGSDAKRKTNIVKTLSLHGKNISANLREWLDDASFLPTDAEITDPTLIKVEEVKAEAQTAAPEQKSETKQPETTTKEENEAPTTLETPVEVTAETPKFRSGQKVVDTKSKSKQILTYNGEDGKMISLTNEKGEEFKIEKDFLTDLKAIPESQTESEETEDEDEGAIVPDMGGMMMPEVQIEDEAPVADKEEIVEATKNKSSKVEAAAEENIIKTPEAKTEIVSGWDSEKNILRLDSGDEVNFADLGLTAEKIPSKNKSSIDLNVVGKNKETLFSVGIRKETDGNYTIYTKKDSNEKEAASGSSESNIKPVDLKRKLDKEIAYMLTSSAEAEEDETAAA